MEFRPDPPTWGWVSFTADVLALHAVIWPKYLKL